MTNKNNNQKETEALADRIMDAIDPGNPQIRIVLDALTMVQGWFEGRLR